MAEPGPFDEPETLTQQPPPRYETRALRHPLRVLWTDGGGPHAVVLDGPMVVGSAAGAQILVDDPAVSRIHAHIELRSNGVWVHDLGSRNGTYVSGVQVALGCVPDGGTVRVGSTLLTFQREPTPTAVELWASDRMGPLLGRSVAMRELFMRLHRIAGTDSTVLVQGETGTGKELVAEAIHAASPRAELPFVVVDCAALPEALLEAELFGHAKGAFTGAMAPRAGAIESAEGGTVFVDEVGELPLAMQPKLLRVLESRTVRRIGETSPRKVDVRFIAATNRDIAAMVNAGTFREDLYFRLAVLPVVVPPLRDRLDDVPLLAASFVPSDCSDSLTPDVLDEASHRAWPGNVRELRNFVERVVALGAREALSMAPPSGAPSEATPLSGALAQALDEPLRDARVRWMDALERAYIRRLLERFPGDVARAAQAAGIDRTHLYRLIRKHER